MKVMMTMIITTMIKIMMKLRMMVIMTKMMQMMVMMILLLTFIMYAGQIHKLHNGTLYGQKIGEDKCQGSRMCFYYDFKNTHFVLKQ